MALIRYVEGQQRSGSLGATVYSRNRFGQYLRPRSVPVNPNTDRQAVIRTIMRQLTIAWNQDLSAAQRDGWKTYGDNVAVLNKFGEPVFLTGLNHYVRSNAGLLQAGGTRVDDAPTTFNLGDSEQGLGGAASAATQLLALQFDDSAAWASEDDAYQLVYMGQPQNPSHTFFNGPWRLAGTIDGDATTPPTSPTSLSAPFTFVAGQRIWIRTRIARADGRLSEFARVSFLGAV